MKLSLICELFTDLGGVDFEIESGGIRTSYSFTVGGDEFTVIMVRESYHLSAIISTTNNVYVRVAGVYLKGPKQFDMTNKLSGFTQVYRSLLAAVNHYVTNNKPDALSFSGADVGMDLVYDRMIRRLADSNNYVLFGSLDYDTFVVSKDFIASLDDDDRELFVGASARGMVSYNDKISRKRSTKAERRSMMRGTKSSAVASPATSPAMSEREQFELDPFG